MQSYDTLKTLPVTQKEESKLSLDNASPEDIPHFEEKLMSLPMLTSNKVVQLPKKWHILQEHIKTSAMENKQKLLVGPGSGPSQCSPFPATKLL